LVTNEVVPMAITTVGLLPAQVGYEVYDPNNSATEPIDVIGWLITNDGTKNISKPFTMYGDPPAGWQVRNRSRKEMAPPTPPGPLPVITSLSPTSDNTGSRVISVRGTGFIDPTTIIFNNQEMTTTRQADDWLQATIAGPPATYDIFVRNANGNSNIVQFQFK
jgi:IPT/TIG domain